MDFVVCLLKRSACVEYCGELGPEIEGDVRERLARRADICGIRCEDAAEVRFTANMVDVMSSS